MLFSTSRLNSVTFALFSALIGGHTAASLPFRMRHTDAALMPRASAISRMVMPSASISATFARLTTTRGRPPTRPCRRAFSRPAIVRSLSRIRSCLAMVARMLSTASLKIPHESRYCSVPRQLRDFPRREAGAHLSERTVAGLERARKQGRIGGRPRVVTDRQKVADLRAAGKSLGGIAAEMDLSKTTAARIGARDGSLRAYGTLQAR